MVLGSVLVACAPAVTMAPDVTATSAMVASANAAALSAQFRAAETQSLCAAYVLSSTVTVSRQMIEAELVSRGVTTCDGAPIGTQSAGEVGQVRFVRTAETAGVAGHDYDCSDFGNAAAAQRFFLASGGPTVDPYGLDGDGDGAACEWGTEIRRVASLRVSPPAPRVAVPAPRSSAGQCYTGPRGGTYTITASGNRNYDGC